MSLKDLWLADQAAGEDPFRQTKIAPAYTQWLETPETDRPGVAGGPPWSPAALEHRRKVEAGEYKHIRSGRYSPSGLTKCPRRVMFSYLGVPEAPRVDIPLENMAGFGNMRHLHHQMVGITMGYLDAGEVWAHHAGYAMGGSLDGLGADCGIFELKSVASTKYDRVVTRDREPLFEHVMQLHAYFLAREYMGHDEEWASLLYEDRNYGKYFEFRVRRSEEMDSQVIALLREMKGYVDLNTLPEMLADCERSVGSVYRECPYAVPCHAAASSARG